MNVYENCPVFENEKFLLRRSLKSDAKDLLKVYSDAAAVPFFNSDNCHGDNFHYSTIEKMESALDFWEMSYQNGYFVRWTILDKAANEAVGTIELFHRDAEDYFTNCGILRLDLRSDFEKSGAIENILPLILGSAFEIFNCDKIATKAVLGAAQRQSALKKLGFKSSCEKLTGNDGTAYGDYFVLLK